MICDGMLSYGLCCATLRYNMICYAIRDEPDTPAGPVKCSPPRILIVAARMCGIAGVADPVAGTCAARVGHRSEW
eukprot:7910624-Pyramimonas_sp.AAC.1